MNAAENSPSPDTPQKDKAQKPAPSSKPSRSSTDKKPVPPSVQAPAAVSLEVLLNPAALLAQVINAPDLETQLTSSDPSLAVLADLVEAMKSGESVDDLRLPILQLTGNQEERAKLVRSLMLSHDYSRLAKFLIIRDKLEQVVLSYAVDGKFSPAESLSFYRTVREEIGEIQGSVSEGAAAAGDVTTMLNKVTFATKAQEGELAKKMKGSPYNRELVRKLVYKLGKLVKDKKSKA